MITFTEEILNEKLHFLCSELSQITIVCDHGHRFIRKFDSQQFITEPKRGNATSVLQLFTFGTHFLIVQVQTFINENFCFLRQVHRFWCQFFLVCLCSTRFYGCANNVIMTFFGEHLEGKRWQFSTKLGLIVTLISSNISKTFYLRPLLATLVRVPDVFRHSLLENCSLT